MVAVDSSTFIAYMVGSEGRDVDLFVAGLGSGSIVLPPVVLTELLSEPSLENRHRTVILDVPVLEVSDYFWARAGTLRAKLISRKLRARLADTLIAQSCIDHDVALITRDDDFRHFAKHGGLRLA